MNLISKSSLFAAAVVVCASAAQAAPIVWTITGLGTVSAVQTDGEATLTYDRPGLWARSTWQVRGVAPSAGDYGFVWNYTGDHSKWQVTAFLTSTTGDVLMREGPTFDAAPLSGGFSFSGEYIFRNVVAGSIIGFNMGGGHFDSARVTRGALSLNQVPEPGSMALAGLGLLALTAARRRKA